MDNTNPASGTGPQNAQMPNYNLNPREMRLERQGADTVAVSRRFPQIRGGQCEACGVIDPRQPAHLQYKLCPHYRGMEAKCVYCPKDKEQTEIVRISKLLVAEHPYQPGVLIMWCNSTECGRKHLERFKISR
jgi:hypothetical protein